MHKIVTCASYGSSGSGIVTDYLMEFDGIYNPGDYEFRFVQDFGGITTLEDCLVHSRHRMNSDTAIRLFKQYVDYQSGDCVSKRYCAVFGKDFKKISYQFIEEITDVKWKGHWEEDQVLAPKIVDILYYKIYPRIKRFLDGNNKYIGRYYPTRPMYFSSPTYERFTNAVNNYLNRLFDVVDPNNKYQFLYFDQLLPPYNNKRYFDYFDDLHLIVVDRDPRDYYIENVMRWGDTYIPHEVDKFVKHYKSLRETVDENTDHPNVLRIRMEDAIYKYDEFKKRINAFLSLDEANHAHPCKYFNPDVSINNTQLWNKYKVSPDIMTKLEKNLYKYFYHF